MGCTFCSLLYPCSPLAGNWLLSADEDIGWSPQTCCERSVMQWDHIAACRLLPSSLWSPAVGLCPLGSWNPMYALISLAIVCHIVLELAKHCWAYVFVSVMIWPTTSSSKNRENSSMGSLDIGTAGPVSPTKGATVTEVRSLLYPQAENIHNILWLHQYVCGVT